jgi:hypothetical protein
LLSFETMWLQLMAATTPYILTLGAIFFNFLRTHSVFSKPLE